MTKFNQNIMDRRNFVTATANVTAIFASGYLDRMPIKRPKILFVCQAGTAKSPIARELLKRRAKERGIAIDVISRGIIIEDHVSPELRQRLVVDGIETAAEPAMPLLPTDWAASDILVTFNALPASVNHKSIRDWSDVPSVNADYAHARPDLDKRIDALLTEVGGWSK